MTSRNGPHKQKENKSTIWIQKILKVGIPILIKKRGEKFHLFLKINLWESTNINVRGIKIGYQKD